MRFDVMMGFVEIEYGVRMVGDCIIDQGVLMVGVTLIIGMGRAGRDPLEAAAAAAPALRFRRPSWFVDAAAADEPAPERPP